MKLYPRFLGWVIFCALGLFYFFLFIEPIELTTLDLGRHLANGRIFFEDFSIPSENLYSFTHPNFPFVNHHWGSGVIFYGIERMFGFAGLSVFSGILAVATFFLFFHIAWRHGGMFYAAPLAMLVIPLLAHRNDIRPELFSYFFCGAFFWILWNWREGYLNKKWLFLLPIFEIIWANLHSYFIIGLGILGVFLIESMILAFGEWRKGIQPRHLRDAQFLFWITCATIFTTLVNPFFARGALVPFRIFGNYGYRVLENQSVWFIRRVLGFHPPSLFFLIAFGVLAVSWGAVFVSWRKKGKQPALVLIILSLTFSFLGWLAIRNFALFGYFMLSLSAINFRSVGGQRKTKENMEYFGKALALVLLVFAGLLLANPIYWKTHGAVGLGLAPGVLDALSFFQENNLTGPIFNNYDIGGYLVYGLYPRERVFVDNRPEAYPAEFFENVYVPMQEQDPVWREQDALYNFNVIFFYRQDATPWAQLFLIRRVSDPEWAPVYVDNSVIIFVRRKQANQDIIRAHEIPKEAFFAQSP